LWRPRAGGSVRGWRTGAGVRRSNPKRTQTLGRIEWNEGVGPIVTSQVDETEFCVVRDNRGRRAPEPQFGHRWAAFSALVLEYQQPVGRYLLQLVGELGLALRLTQETFVCAHRAHAGARSGLGIRAWLYRAATRLALRHLHTEQQPAQAPRGYSRPSLDPKAAEQALARSALLDLPGRERAVLL